MFLDFVIDQVDFCIQNMNLNRLLSRLIFGLFAASLILVFVAHTDYSEFSVHRGLPDSLEVDIKSYNGSTDQQGWAPGYVKSLYQEGVIDTLLPKKWDSFVFVTYNYYIVEITLVDLGLLSQISISMTKFKSLQQIHAEYLVSFKLTDFWKGDINITTDSLKFSLTRSQNSTTYTTDIQFVAKYNNMTLSGDLHQYIEKKGCMTFLRPHSSLKCLSGKADGSTSIQYKIVNKQYGYEQEISDTWGFRDKISAVMFDGFRGAGYYWYWVWGMGIGWNENVETGAVNKQPIREIGISLGFMLGKEENFITIDGQAIKLHNVTFQLGDGLTQNEFSFKSQVPKAVFRFQVKSRHVLEDNKLVAHKYIEKVYGIWHGQIQFHNGTVFDFSKAFGLIEVSKSRF